MRDDRSESEIFIEQLKYLKIACIGDKVIVTHPLFAAREMLNGEFKDWEDMKTIQIGEEV